MEITIKAVYNNYKFVPVDEGVAVVSGNFKSSRIVSATRNKMGKILVKTVNGSVYGLDNPDRADKAWIHKLMGKRPKEAANLLSTLGKFH